MTTTTFCNAKLVTADEAFQGSLRVADGKIGAIEHATAQDQSGCEDMQGDYLLPGLIELHTDNLERHARPRPGVRWPTAAAALAHDAELAAAGVTTVFNAVAIGGIDPHGDRTALLFELIDAVDAAAAAGSLRIEHRLHLRCELSIAGMVDEWRRLADHPRLGLVSLMDHTPGQRQFVNLDAYREYYQGKYGLSDGQMEAFIAARRADGARYSSDNRRALAAECRERDLPLASHDDATVEHVSEAQELGVRVAEFPTTERAARASRDAGMAVLVGAPNLVRGRSHSGNVSARELASRRLVDVLSSDYVPHSALLGAFALPALQPDYSLAAAVAMVTRNPARALGLDDRGELSPGKRADLVRVRFDESTQTPAVRGVWRGGARVL